MNSEQLALWLKGKLPNVAGLHLDPARLQVRHVLNWGGFVNHSFSIEDGASRYHLKITNDVESADKLRAWSQVHDLLEKRYRAPRFIDWLDFPEIGFAGLLQEHVEGRTARFGDDVVLVRQLIELMHRLHDDAEIRERLHAWPSPKTYFDHFVDTYFERFTADMQTIAAGHIHFVTAHLLQWMRDETDRLRDAANAIPSFHDPAKEPVHGDLTEGNVIVGTDEWFVVDWDDLALGDPAVDFAVLLWPLVYEGRNWREFLSNCDDGFSRRMELCLRAQLLDEVIDPLADYVEACAVPSRQDEVQLVKRKRHEEALARYRHSEKPAIFPPSRYGAYSKHVNPGLGRFLELTGRDLKLVHGQGGTIVDAVGRKFDDWISGFGSLNLGHNPETVKEAIRRHLETSAPNLYIENLNPYAGQLAHRLITAAGPAFETVFFSNSGSEAVEAAIKTAMAAKSRHRIAYAEGGYHGTTLGALACMARGSYRDDFDDLLADFCEVPFSDLNVLEDTLRGGDIAAFLVEPIQVEAGLRIATAEYLRGVRELCNRYGVLLMFDEVQTGMGRTGRLFAWQGYAVTPDVFILAKSLGGGFMPIGATIMGSGIWKQAFGTFRRSEIHNSTFGGNALACVAALATLEVIDNAEFLRRVRERAEELFADLECSIQDCRIVEAVPWKGLLGGIRFREGTHPWLRPENLDLTDFEGVPMSGIIAIERLSRRNILAQVCGHNWSVLRIEPPLVVERDACKRFVEAITDVVHWMERNV